ncbi:MAG: hypothetical protein M0018_06910 [Nitrospiraceae bacterium]|nr:hypothetical protein [Nitrospiraceae bacterium]
MGKHIRFECFPALAVAVLLLSGCAVGVHKTSISSDMVGPTPPGSALDASRAGEISKLNALNKKHEADLLWIENSYSRLQIKDLMKVPPAQYASYKKYLDEGSVYIIVHPAYYVFFSGPQLVTGDDPPVENAVERFLSLTPDSGKMAVLQAQERNMRDFLAYAAMRKKLVLLILPRAYRLQPGYNYYGWYDEYTRYINQVAGGSSSVLFLESSSSSRGYLTKKDRAVLLDFLAAIRPERVLLGGGYVGRCQEEFYQDLTGKYGAKGVYLVPEISDISPTELKDGIATRLLRASGGINNGAAATAIEQNTFKIENVIPQIYNIH